VITLRLAQKLDIASQMKWYATILFAFLLMLSPETEAQSHDSTSRFRCAGSVKIACERGRKTIWRNRFYQLNGNVHLSVRDGQVLNETHNFVMTGFLQKGRQPRFTGISLDGQFALYENEHFYLRIPLEGETVYFMQKYFKPLGTNGSRDLWQPLQNDQTDS